MSAHTGALELGCRAPGCRSRASVEVYNTWNEPMGKYCRRHGEQRVKELRAREIRAQQP